MDPLCVNVHPVYGAIYKEGEFVQRGAVLGLSVDSSEVVTAPTSGWVHLPTEADANVYASPGIRIEIRPQPVTHERTSSAELGGAP